MGTRQATFSALGGYDKNKSAKNIMTGIIRLNRGGRRPACHWLTIGCSSRPCDKLLVRNSYSASSHWFCWDNGRQSMEKLRFWPPPLTWTESEERWRTCLTEGVTAGISQGHCFLWNTCAEVMGVQGKGSRTTTNLKKTKKQHNFNPKHVLINRKQQLLWIISVKPND